MRIHVRLERAARGNALAVGPFRGLVDARFGGDNDIHFPRRVGQADVEDVVFFVQIICGRRAVVRRHGIDLRYDGIVHRNRYDVRDVVELQVVRARFGHVIGNLLIVVLPCADIEFDHAAAVFDVFISWSVMPPKAETTTMTGSSAVSTMRLTLKMLLAVPTDEPPNFITFMIYLFFVFVRLNNGKENTSLFLCLIPSIKASCLRLAVYVGWLICFW